MAQEINRRGQVTLWVIIALILVGGILLLFLGRSGKNAGPQSSFVEGSNPQQAIESCARQVAKSVLEKAIPQGGFVEPKRYRTYLHTNVSYLCENIGYFAPCVNQHPLLLAEVRAELERVLTPEIEACFQGLKMDLEGQQTEMMLGAMDFHVSLGPQRVRLEIQREMQLTEQGQTQTFRDFTTDMVHPAYDLINVAQEIASQEAKYCYFEYVGYMAIYPQFDIKKFAFSDATKIYTIQERETQQTMNIAVRGCALPEGV